MYCNPTLTAEEFKTIHNSLCDLDSVVQHLEEVLKPELYVKLARAASEIRQGLSGAYEQDSKSFDNKHDHYDDVRSQLGLNNSVWSIFEVDNLSDRHPFEGADRVVYKDHWGDKPVSCSINGATWAALYIAANACIRDSGDQHHIFIEQFKPAKDDSRTLILQTGS
ncbi:MAG: hypothetical protein RLZZ196_550 [Bacteroidota bacterium]|jgi:hypothetical protein